MRARARPLFLRTVFQILFRISQSNAPEGLIEYTCDSKSQTLRMRYPFQSTGRPIFTPKLLVGLRLHYTVARFRAGAKFSSQYNNRGEPTRGDSRRHDVLWWYHVNKCRAMRGNRSELALVRKSPRCHVNTSCRYCK